MNNKFITKIIGASLAIAMMIGVGAGVNFAKEAKRVDATNSTYNKVASLTAGDEVLIVALKGSTNYYLPVGNGSSGAPAASTVAVNNNSIEADLDSNLFTVEASGDNWKFKNGSNYLYTTGSNNGVRIGTNEDNIFAVTEKNNTKHYFQMKNTATNRYIGVYQTQDWRCYTSDTQSNYGNPSSANQVMFFKKAAAKTLSSISVATAPTKTTYYAGDYFDPTGLVITRTYSDSTSDTYAYANHASDFTFTPSTSTALTTDNSSVTIGYGGKTTTQAITVNAQRTMSSIQLHGTIAKTEYYVGDSWDLDGLDIQVNWSEGDPTYIDLDDANVLYDCSPATAIDTSTTSFDIEIMYDNFDEIFTVDGLTVTEHPLTDVLDKTTIPAAAVGTGTNWGTLTEVSDYTYAQSNTNGAKYKVSLLEPTSNEFVGRVNDKATGGFFTSKAPVGVRIKTITFSAITPDKNVSVYLQNEPYTNLPTTGDYVATLTSESLSYTVEGNFSCFAIRGRNSGTNVGALTIEYEEINPSMSASPSSITLSSNGTQNVEISVINYTSKPTLECNVQSGASSIASATVGNVNNEYKATATITATSVSGNAVVRVRDTANPSAYYVDINVTVQSAKDVIEGTVTTSSSLSYRYNRSGATVDSLDFDLLGVSGTSYTDWEDVSSNSSAVYAGNSAAGNDTIQLRATKPSGIVTTVSGGQAKKVTVAWSSHTSPGRTLDVYGKNTAYESSEDLYNDNTKGTKIGSIVYGTSTTLNIDSEYEYIGVRSNNSALYLDSINIQWGEYTYTYSDISMRFGGSVNEDVWSELDTNEHLIAGVGVMITSYEEQLRTPYSIKEHAAEAVPSNQEHNINTQIVDYYAPLSTFDIPKQNNNYYWNLRYEIASSSEEDIIDSYTAAAYIKLTNGELVFLKQVRYSVWSLANDYLNNRECDQETAGGSLYALAHSVQMS